MCHVHRAGRRVQPDCRADAVGGAHQPGAVRRLYGGHDAWPRGGTASQVVFIALAAIGVPVLANFQGGPSAIFGKTGGYAIGYILTALITALLSKVLGRKFWALCVAMVVGCAACYVLGTIWFMILTGADLVSALGWCVLPYLPGDAVKIALAAALTIQLDKRLKGSLV